MPHPRLFSSVQNGFPLYGVYPVDDRLQILYCIHCVCFENLVTFWHALCLVGQSGVMQNTDENCHAGQVSFSQRLA